MSSNFKKYSAVIIVVVALAGAAYLFISGSSEDVPGNAPGSEVPALACSFEVGQELGYKLQVISESKFDQASLTSNRPDPGKLHSIKPTMQSFNARMHWKIVRDYNQGRAWKIAAVLTDIDWRIADRPVRGDLIEGIQEPFTFIVHKDCLFGNFNISPYIANEAGEMVSKMLKVFEMQVDNLAGSTVYNAAQIDDTGAYVARYKIKTASSGYDFIKEKISYSRIKDEFAGFSNPNGGGRLMPVEAKILTSETKGAFPESGNWFTRINGVEHVQLKRGTASFADVRGRHNLEFTPDRQIPESLTKWIDSNFFRKMPRVKLTNIDGVASIEYVPKEDLTKVTWEEALERFTTRFLRRDTDPTAYMEALHFLKDYLIVHPEKAFDLIDEIRSGELSEEFHATIFLALELAGTGQAQQALIQAARDDSLGGMNRMRAIIALMNVPSPSSEAISTLVELSHSASSEDDEEAFNVASTAVLALGTLDNRFEGDAEVRSLLQSELRGRLDDQEAMPELVVALDAVNNSGDEDLIPNVAQLFNYEDEPIRAHAARALVRMKDPRVEPLLVNIFIEDESAEVRAAAAGVLGDRSESGYVEPSKQTVADTKKHLGVESQPKVRREMIRILGPVAQKNPQAKSALVNQFKQETSTENLVLIGRFLPAEDLVR